jgi:hypothetical protein
MKLFIIIYISIKNVNKQPYSCEKIQILDPGFVVGSYELIIELDISYKKRE